MAKSRNRKVNATCPPKWTGFFVLSVLLMSLSSCDTSKQQGGMAGRIMPNITGGAGEVLVVMDAFNWDNSASEMLKLIGETVDNYKKE